MKQKRVTMSAPNIQIEKLDDVNYDTWSLLMRSILIHSGQWKIVNGDIKNDDEKTKLEWKINDEKALASIYLGVQPAQLIYIRDCKSSNEAWKKLQEVHRPKGPVQKVTLYKRLVNLILASGGDVLRHINEFVEINAKLAENGIELQDELLVIMLLSSLPLEYENFVIAMETRDELPKLSVIKQKLLEEGRRRKEKDEQCESIKNVQQQAFVVKSNPKQDYKSRNNNRKKPKSFKGKCFICGEVGHYANKCDKKSQVKAGSEAMTLLAAADCKTFNKGKWYVDSGATSHMCNQRELFIRFVDHAEEIALAGNKHIIATGKGDVKIFNNSYEILLQNVLYSSDLQANFISINKCVENGYFAKFDKMKAEISRKDGQVVVVAHRKDNMFMASNEKPVQMLCSTKPSQSDLWHNRYGHLNNRSLQDLSKKQMVKGMTLNTHNAGCCNTCMLSKIHVLAFPKESESRSNSLLELVHADVCGPFRIKSVGGSSYFVTFIDDMSRKIHVYFLKHKSEVLEKFKTYKLQVEKQTGRKIKTLRSDNGGEFVNRAFDEFLADEGIKRQLTVSYTPQQNGVAERANRTLIEMARSMIIHAGVKHYLWAEAVNTAVYIRNRCPTKKLEDKTPFEVWTGRKPNVSHFKVFGCSAVGLNKSTGKSKLEAKGRQYLMVGYSNTSKAYRLFDTNTQKVEEKRDVLFNENLYPEKVAIVKKCKSGADYLEIYNQEEFIQSCNDNNFDEDVENENTELIHEDSFNTADEQEYLTEEEGDAIGVEEEASVQELVEVRSRGRPKIIRDGKVGRPRKQYCTKTVNELCVAIEGSIPHTVEEALTGTCKQFWEQAMRDEFESLKRNKTWTLEDLPKGHKAIPCKWVFALKRNVNGEIERYKARLVAKGCSQQYGVNYKETFSPVARYSTIRLFLALAVQSKMHLHQIDVKTAYLNGDLTEEIYMKQPQHFVDKNFRSKVLRLRKSIYGLKQSGREWNFKLDSVLKKMKFVACKNEPCLYKGKMDSNLVLIVVYVDDIIIGCSEISVVHRVKQMIANEFEVSDKGKLHHFLGMEVHREGSTGSITLSQSQYIRDLLEQYGMQDCKSVAVPLDAGFQVKCDKDCEKVNLHDYQSLIGSLMYIAISTRPDILHSVSKLAQRNTDPHIEHFAALKRVLRYLSGTLDMKLVYETSDKKLEGFVDADWGGNSMDRKSYTGFVFFFGGNIVSWESRKQPSVALSSTEAEYMALSDAAKEAVYLNRLLKEIINFEANAVTLNIDNQGALKLAENPVYHKRSKHIDIKYHHIRDLVQNQEIRLKYCQTSEMIADIMTKNLSKIKHYYFINKLKLIL